MKKSKTNWNKLNKMEDSDIDTSDIPELDDNFFKNAKVSIRLNTNDKDLHGGLIRASAKLFKLLDEAGNTELRLIWRAALAHKIDHIGVVPMELEDLQKVTSSFKVRKSMIPIIKQILENDIPREYKSVSPWEYR